MLPQCVNQVYRGQIQIPSEILFDKLILTKCLKNSTVSYYGRKPRMYSIQSKGKWTFLLFSTGKYRIMGSNINLEDIVTSISLCLPNVKSLHPILQTETFVCNLGKSVNLYNFFNSSTTTDSDINLHMAYEPELFPALQILDWNPININLFHTGKVVIMGRNSRQCLDSICAELQVIFV